MTRVLASQTHSSICSDRKAEFTSGNNEAMSPSVRKVCVARTDRSQRLVSVS